MSEGSLVVVGTPIGNLGDLSPRAAEALRSADLICCEDTRRTGQLMKHIGADKKPYLVTNEHSEFGQIERVIERIGSGQTVALVSDAGMPLVSDPGEILVGAVLERGYEVDVVPGPTALSTALAISGISSRRFVFEGFLPRKGRDRAAVLAQIEKETRTVIIYESPHRVARTVSDLAELCSGQRRIAVLRELTKLHQEGWRGSLAEAAEHFEDVSGRGEYVLVLAPGEVEAAEWSDEDLAAELSQLVDAGHSRRDAVAAVVEASGVAKRRVYDLANRRDD